jgi:hypothetical protein
MKTHLKTHMNQSSSYSSSSNMLSNNAMTITSYPPPSQQGHGSSSGGQVPIKILMSSSSSSRVQIKDEQDLSTSLPSSPSQEEEGEMSPPLMSPTSFFSDSVGPSITIDASPQQGSSSPSLQKRPGKQLKFLVN